MALDERFATVPAGTIAAVVTVLEMRAPAPSRPEHGDPAWSLRAIEAPTPEFYLDIYRRVGAPHLWYSRLVMPGATLRATLRHPDVLVHAFFLGERSEGIMELDFRKKGECEIAYFGVTDVLIGTGASRVMMNRAIETAFARGTERLWLHTNTLDHPRALEFYRRSGFTPIERRIEMAPDPRLFGLLPKEAAPNIPML